MAPRNSLVHSPPDLLKSQAAFFGRLSGWRILLWVASLSVLALVLLPVVYLGVRALNGGVHSLTVVRSFSALRALGNTLLLMVSVTAGTILLGVSLAWLTVRTDLPWRRFFSAVLALPLVIPSYIGAYLLVASIGPQGIFARLLESWIGFVDFPSVYGFPGAFYLLTILSYPYVYLTVRAALRGLDPALEEAGRSLGLTNREILQRVVIPQLMPAMIAGGLLVALYVLRDFGAVSILRFPAFTQVLYIQYKSSFNREAGAALALMLVMVALLLLLFDFRQRSKARQYRTPSGAARPAPRSALGRWRWVAAGFCLLVVTLALLIPLGVLFYWLVRGVEAGGVVPDLTRRIGNSLLAAGGAAVVTLLAALPVAILVVQADSRSSRIMHRLSYVGYALPGIVVALAMVFFVSNFAKWIYQGFPVLLAAYLILFLPMASGALQGSLRQIHPALEEAARSLGRSSLGAFLAVTMPLALPGALAGAGLVFLTAMKELPATLILAPLDFSTLATSVWGAVSEAYFARAALPALLLVFFSSIPLGLMMFKENQL